MDRNAIIIATCDDELAEANKTGAILKEHCFNQRLRCEPRVYSSPKAMLANLENIDILFLDVEMPEMNGFEVAEALRCKRSKTRVIFLTNYSEYVQKGYEVQAFRYLYKPCSRQDITDALDAALQNLLICDWFYFATPDKVTHQVYVEDIYYIEALGESTGIHTKSTFYESAKPLYYWQDSFGHHFFKCHKSYLVNMRNIKAVESENVRLINNKLVPLSWRRRGKINKALEEYVRQLSWYM